MKIDLEKIKEQLRWENVKRMFFDFLEKRIKWPFFILMLVMAGYGTYLWFFYVYHQEWSEERKSKYRETRGKSEPFDDKKFDEALKNYSLREERFGRKIEGIEDIFRLDKK